MPAVWRSFITLVVCFGVPYEDRHDRRRQDAAEQQLIDDVRRRIGEVVRVGQASAADRPGESADAQEAGEA